MAGDIGVDTGTLAQAGGQLTDEAKAIIAALDQLSKVLGAQGSPWGGDEVGARFGREYTDFVRQAFTAIGTYHEQVVYSGGGQQAGAKCWVGLERFNSQDVRPAR